MIHRIQAESPEHLTTNGAKQAFVGSLTHLVRTVDISETDQFSRERIVSQKETQVQVSDSERSFWNLPFWGQTRVSTSSFQR